MNDSQILSSSEYQDDLVVGATFSPLPPTPRVLVCVVAKNGAKRLTATLRSIRAQGYPALETVAVDCASQDDSYAILASRLGQNRVVKLDTNPGFGPAMMALLADPKITGPGLDQADLYLFIHDDMVLTPGSIQWLVYTALQDNRMGVVGPKIREWSEEPFLQAMGMSADVFGNCESGMDLGEMDQGQHDIREAALWVPSAGMLIRREAWEQANGFDRRFGMLREDFDLCWRLRIMGWRIGLQGEAIAYHESKATLGTNDEPPTLTPARYRYLATRNETLSVLKNTPTPRLLWLVPCNIVIGIVTILWLILARRWGEAFAIVRAFFAVLVMSGSTKLLHDEVQASRVVSEAVIGRFRTGGIPRIQRGWERIVWLLTPSESQHSQEASAQDEGERWSLGDPLEDQPIQRFVRDGSLFFIGLPVLIMVLFGIANSGAFSPGNLIGGQIVAWPTGEQFLRSLMDATNADPLTSNQFPSPIQAVLGVLTFLIPGESWVASRILIFGLLPVSWFAMMRLGTHITTVKTARVIGATVYSFMPVVLASVGQGQFGSAILIALYPYILHLMVNVFRPFDSKRSWRSAALLVVLGTVVMSASFVSSMLILIPTVVIALVYCVFTLRLGGVMRLLFAGVFALLVLAPWLWDWLNLGGITSFVNGQEVGLATAYEVSPLRAFLGDPLLVFASLDKVAVGSLLVPLAIVVGSFFVGLPNRPILTGSLLLVSAASALATWALSTMGFPAIWPPVLLLPGAVAMSALMMIVTTYSVRTIRYQQQRPTIGLVFTITAGIGLIMASLNIGSGAWQQLHVDPPLLPAFIGADQNVVGEQRVLLIRNHEVNGHKQVQWELREATGSTMIRFGTLGDKETINIIDQALSTITSEINADAGSTLGLLNIRMIVVQDSDPQLTTALSAQSWLEPIATETATVFTVKTWLPRVSVLTTEAAVPFLSLGTLPESTELATGERVRLLGQEGNKAGQGVSISQQQGQNWAIHAKAGHGGVLILSDGYDGGWHAYVNGQELERAHDVGPFNVENVVNIWRIPAGETNVTLKHLGSKRHTVVLLAQLLVLLVALSFAVRPPGRHRRRPVPDDAQLPQSIKTMTEETGAIPVISIADGIRVNEDANGFAQPKSAVAQVFDDNWSAALTKQYETRADVEELARSNKTDDYEVALEPGLDLSLHPDDHDSEHVDEATIELDLNSLKNEMHEPSQAQQAGHDTQVPGNEADQAHRDAHTDDNPRNEQ